jgi:hypothetical protein
MSAWCQKRTKCAAAKKPAIRSHRPRARKLVRRVISGGFGEGVDDARKKTPLFDQFVSAHGSNNPTLGNYIGPLAIRSERLTPRAKNFSDIPVAATLTNRLLQCEPELRDERGTAPARHETLGISHRVDDSAGRGAGIAGENEAVLFRQVGVEVAQVEIEHRAGEGHARAPVEIGGQREATQCGRLIAEPVIADAARQRSSDVLRQRGARQVDAQAERRVLAPRACIRDVRRVGETAGEAQRLADPGVGARACLQYSMPARTPGGTVSPG